MSIKIIKGNIFTSKCQVLVNTVNCVGVMGAGIALEIRLRYPDLYEKYVRLCEGTQMHPGLLWIYKSDDHWILNFPTKNHWKHPSREEYLHLGLRKFLDTYEARGITSIAFPLLGADRGGIDPERSKTIMTEYLEHAQIPVEIYLYDPSAEDDLFNDFKKWLLDGGDAILAESYKVRKDIVAKVVEAVSRDSTRQLNQLGRVKGIGIKTLERVFQAARKEMTSPTQIGLHLE